MNARPGGPLRTVDGVAERETSEKVARCAVLCTTATQPVPVRTAATHSLGQKKLSSHAVQRSKQFGGFRTGTQKGAALLK
jgi:hypothetical protein